MLFGLALSGLQKFIFDIVDPNTKKDRHAAKRLRIRSVLLSLVPAVAAHKLHKLDPNLSIHYLGGGKLLCDTSAQACMSIESDLRELYQWLVDTSGGVLGMYWSTVEGSGKDTVELSKLLKSLSKAKWRAGKAENWLHSADVRKPLKTSSLGNPEWEKNASGQLARDSHITGFKAADTGWQIGPFRALPERNNPDIGLAGKSSEPVKIPIPLYVPRTTSGDIAPLTDLAEEAEAAPYLALLKLDGDHIGKLLGESLSESTGENYRRTSRLLNRFFGEDIPDLLANEFDRIYLVYSGGDDLVATGHFETVLNAALRIRSEFNQLNLNTTVSAGISFYTRNAPILHAVEKAERHLGNAKEIRNAINIGGCRLTWDEYKHALTEIDELVLAVKNGSVNRGILQTLRHLGNPWLPDAPEAIHNQRYHSIPQINYLRSRRDNWRENEWGKNLKMFMDNLCAIEKNYSDKLDSAWHRASLLGTIAGWKTKTVKEQG